MEKRRYLLTIAIVILGAIGCPALLLPTDGGDVLGGRDLYDTHCAACHVLDTYDISGFAPNLAGWQDQISVDSVMAHPGIPMGEVEVANLRAFLSLQYHLSGRRLPPERS